MYKNAQVLQNVIIVLAIVVFVVGGIVVNTAVLLLFDVRLISFSTLLFVASGEFCSCTYQEEGFKTAISDLAIISFWCS